MTNEELNELQRLRAENEALKRAKPNATIKVSEKGCVSMYLTNRRYPVSLYPEEWKQVLAAVPKLNSFLEEYESALQNNTAN